MNIPITQSEAWEQFQNDLGKTCFFAQGNGYQYLAILETTPVGNYLYLPYGPVVSDTNGYKNAFKTLQNLAQKHQAIFIRVEPMNPDIPQYFPDSTKKSKDLNPKDTWILDLSPDKETIISNFSQGTRTRYNTFSKKGLQVESTRELSEIKHLVRLQNKLYKTKNLNSFSEEYLKTELSQPFSSLYLVKYQASLVSGEPKSPAPEDNQVIAASLFFDYKNTRYYMQSAADLEFKKLPATVALLTTAIFDAKEKGMKYFDFWGIAPDDAPADHPWKGFTEFKKSFGGRPAHYAGTYDIILKPTKYRLYQSLRTVNRVIRKA